MKRIITSFILISAVIAMMAENIIVSASAPLQQQFSTDDATYEIREHIDLKGITLTLPTNAKLKFKGGTLFNGKLNGQIANKSISITDLGASTQMDTFNAEAIENATRICSMVKIPDGTFFLTRTPIIRNNNVSIIGQKNSVLKSHKTMAIIETQPGIHNITIKNLYLNGVGSNTIPSYLLNVEHNADGIWVENCTFDGGTGGVMINYEGANVTVKGCTFRNMVYIPGAGLAIANGPKAGGAGGYGVVFQHIGNQHRGVNHGLICKNTFESTVIRHATYMQSSNDVTIKNNKIYGTTDMNSMELLTGLVTTGLTPEQVASIDIKKHMTVADYAMEFRGCTNVVIISNTVTGGIGFINGTTDYMDNQGENFTIIKNKITDIHHPASHNITNLHYVNGVEMKKNKLPE